MPRNYQPSPYSLKSRRRSEYLYTKGLEYSLNGENYVGEYHIKGREVFTGPVPSPTSQQLRKYYTNHDLYMYDKARGFKERIRVQPNQIVWAPIETEFTTGFSTRYFVERIGNMEGYPIEIDQDQYNNYGLNRGIDEGVYITVKLKWKLTGPLRSIMKNNELFLEGIYDHNQREVMSKARDIPNLEYAIKSYTEYARVTIRPNDVKLNQISWNSE